MIAVAWWIVGQWERSDAMMIAAAGCPEGSLVYD